LLRTDHRPPLNGCGRGGTPVEQRLVKGRWVLHLRRTTGGAASLPIAVPVADQRQRRHFQQPKLIDDRLRIKVSTINVSPMPPKTYQALAGPF
jgi:hypothetical protein